MKYAPVLITTVNRFEHFRKCLESLNECTWADQTDVFVAVDYPGKEEHFAGYKRIREYLLQKHNFCFHSLNIIYRETNYFYSGKGNLRCLIDEVFKKFDRCIVSEDDNVFSPNFLMFMDKALDKFEKDTTILAINGYRHYYPLIFDDNTFLRQNVDFSAWGYGIWKNRNFSWIDRDYFRKKLNWKNIKTVHKNGLNRVADFIHFSIGKGKLKIQDNTLSVYMALEGMDVIMPKESLVRNVGWDNTGEHCKTNDKYLQDRHMNQSISQKLDFVFVGSGFEHYIENRDVFKRYSYGRISYLKFVGLIIKYFCKFLLNK